MSIQHTCTQDLLNGVATNCSLIRERMLPVDEVDDGKILLHGNHTIDEINRCGTYLVLFNDSVSINGIRAIPN